MLRVKESEVKQVTRSMKWRLTELNKGREISNENFGVFNFFKRTTKKMFVFVHAQCIKTVHAGEGVKIWLNSVHVVIE